MNLLELLKQDGLNPARASSSKGGEYASPCPACGGHDRFRVWPEAGRFWCRGCNASGDEIEYLRLFRKMTFTEACHALGKEPGFHPDRKPKAGPHVWTPREIVTPPDAWQEKAGLLVAWAERQLWTPAGEPVRAFLHERRITDETIHAARLGWNPKDVWRDREAWGLEPEANGDGKPKRLWIPAGMMIPLCIGGKVARVRIRRPEGEPRYYLLPGSATAAMVLGNSGPCLVVESELDCILMNQEGGDLITAVCMGSAQNPPDKDTAARLKRAPLVLLSLDSDAAGERSSWQGWPKHFPNARRWPVPDYKDPGEAAKAGFPLRTWVEAGLLKYLGREPDAPQTTASPAPLPYPCPRPKSPSWPEGKAKDAMPEPDFLGIGADAFMELCKAIPPELAEGLRLAAEVFEGAVLLGFEPA